MKKEIIKKQLDTELEGHINTYTKSNTEAHIETDKEVNTETNIQNNTETNIQNDTEDLYKIDFDQVEEKANQEKNRKGNIASYKEKAKGQSKEVEKEKKNQMPKIIALFMVAMLILTMLSRTIDELLLPTVKVQPIKSGALEHSFSEKGIVELDPKMVERRKQDIVAPRDGKILEYQVTEGSSFLKDRVFFDFQPEQDEDETVALQEELDRDTLRVQKEALKREKEELYKDKQVVQDKKTKLQEDYKRIETKIEAIRSKNEIADLEKQVAINEELYAAGAMEKESYDTAKVNLERLKKEYQEWVALEQKQITDQLEEIDIQLETFDKPIVDLEERIDLTDKQIELVGIKQGLKTIKAKMDGWVYEIYQYDDTYVKAGEPLLTVIPANVPYVMHWSIPIEQGDIIKEKDTLSFSIRNRTYETEVTDIELDLERGVYEVQSELTQEMVQELMLDPKKKLVCTVKYSKKTEEYAYVVPASSIVEEKGKDYVYIVEEYDTVWGRKYQAKKIGVQVLEDDHYNVGVKAAFPADASVVVHTTKVLEDGLDVKVE